MVHSEAVNVAEELARSSVSEAEPGKAVAEERVMSAEPDVIEADVGGEVIELQQPAETQHEPEVPSEAAAAPPPAPAPVHEAEDLSEASLSIAPATEEVKQETAEETTEEPTGPVTTEAPAQQEVDVTEAAEQPEAEHSAEPVLSDPDAIVEAPKEELPAAAAEEQRDKVQEPQPSHAEVAVEEPHPAPEEPSYQDEPAAPEEEASAP